MLAGLLTDPLAPPSFGKWINYAGNNHVGAVSFLIVVFLLFFGVAVLTLVQASQVCLSVLLYSQYIAGTLILAHCQLTGYCPAFNPMLRLINRESLLPI